MASYGGCDVRMSGGAVDVDTVPETLGSTDVNEVQGMTITTVTAKKKTVPITCASKTKKRYQQD